MAHTPKHSVSVAGIVVDDQDRVLVIKRRDNGHWEPPGGVLELHETPEEGARREVQEETGILFEVERLSGVYKNMTKGIVALVFRGSPIAGSLHVTAETSAVEWLCLEEAVAGMSPAFAVRIEDAFRPHAQFRAHDGVQLLDAEPSSGVINPLERLFGA